MVLKENEVCPYAEKCPYNQSVYPCQGSVLRKNIFACSYVDETGNFTGKYNVRNPLDDTGKMKILMENQDG